MKLEGNQIMEIKLWKSDNYKPHLASVFSVLFSIMNIIFHSDIKTFCCFLKMELK